MRRVVTGVDEQGVAVFRRDDESPHCLQMGGFEMGELWFDPSATISDGASDWVANKIGGVPNKGEVMVRYVKFPPQQEMQHTMATGDLETSAGLETGGEAKTDTRVGEGFLLEDDDPSMHTTETIDYGFVLQGSITLELDNGAKRELHPGDCYIQNGTRHAWRNETDQPAVIGVVMLGAKR